MSQSLIKNLEESLIEEKSENQLLQQENLDLKQEIAKLKELKDGISKDLSISHQKNEDL